MTRKAQGGFSLIELVITLVILAILVALGLPSYREWMNNTRIRTAAESIQNGLRIARNEAAQRGTTVRFELGETSGAADWVVCVLPTGMTTCAAAKGADPTNIIQTHAVGETQGVLVSASTDVATATTYTTALADGVPAGITFNPLARPDAYGTGSIVRIDTSSAQPDSRRLVTTISSGGMVRMCDPAVSTDTTGQGCTK